MPHQPPPQIPEIRTLNKIVKMWMIPCAIPIEVWIETLLPALALALLSFVTPGRVEYIEMPLGRYHGLGGKITRSASRKFLPGWADVAQKVWKFTLLGPIERILFWWMIVDLVIETLFNWESMAVKMAGCDPNTWIGTGDVPGFSPYVATNWQPVAWTAENDPHHLIGVTHISCPPGRTMSLGFSVPVGPFLGAIGALQTRLMKVGSTHPLWVSEMIPGSMDTTARSAHFRTKMVNHETGVEAYQVEAIAQSWPVDIAGAEITVEAYPS